MPETDCHVYDLKGLKCPLPVLKTRKRMKRLAPGARIAVETTDPLAVIDIPHFCNEDGHRLERSEAVSGGHRFLIRKKLRAISAATAACE